MKRDFKGVFIPSDLWLDSTIPAMEKLILVEIMSLDYQDGCFASNKHFSKMFGLGERRIQQILQSLKNKGLIDVFLIYKSNSKEIEKRIIRSSIDCKNVVKKNTPTSRKILHETSRKILHEGGEENYADSNNIIHNTINSITHNINKTIKRNTIDIGKEDIFEKVLQSFNKLCPSLPKVLNLSASRKNKIKLRLKEMKNDLTKLNEVFAKIESSDFLKGNNNRNWRANFDWIFANSENWVKVIEGNYKQKEQRVLSDDEIYIQKLRKQSPVKTLTDEELKKHHQMSKVFAIPFDKYIIKLIDDGKIKL